MAADKLWCRVTLVDGAGGAIASRVLEGPTDPDLATVDDVARLTLLARRLGGNIVLSEVSTAMRQLLELAGLDAELGGASTAPVAAEGPRGPRR